MNKKIIISILVALALLAASVHWFLLKPVPLEDEMAVCTMEALICPDGSGVGRSGPKCEFSPCPNLYSHTGLLVQEGEKFHLEIDAPSDLGGRDIYTMPLKFSRVSNVLADFVGKKVAVKGTFTSGSTLEVSTIELAQ